MSPQSERDAPVPTVRVQAHKKAYGRYLFLSMPKPIVDILDWSEGDICEVLTDKDKDTLIFRRVYRKRRGKLGSS